MSTRITPHLCSLTNTKPHEISAGQTNPLLPNAQSECFCMRYKLKTKTKSQQWLNSLYLDEITQAQMSSTISFSFLFSMQPAAHNTD